MASKHEKLIEEIGKMTVLDLADLVKELETVFGVSAAVPVAAATVATVPAAGAATAVSEEKAEYKVTLQDAGSEKIKVIKALKSLIPNLSLSDAKVKVEEAPTVIAESASKDDAMKMKKELEAAGARVELA